MFKVLLLFLNQMKSLVFKTNLELPTKTQVTKVGGGKTGHLRVEIEFGGGETF